MAILIDLNTFLVASHSEMPVVRLANPSACHDLSQLQAFAHAFPSSWSAHFLLLLVYPSPSYLLLPSETIPPKLVQDISYLLFVLPLW